MLHCEYCYFPSSGKTACSICGSESFLTDECLRVTVVGSAEDLASVLAPVELLRRTLGDDMFRRTDRRNSGLIEIGQLPGYKPGKIGLAIRLIEVYPDSPAADSFALAYSDATAILIPLELDLRFDQLLEFIRRPEIKAMLSSRVVWTAMVSRWYHQEPAMEEHPHLWSVDRFGTEWANRQAAARNWFQSSFGESFDWFVEEINPWHSEFAILRSIDTLSDSPMPSDAVFLEALLRAASAGADRPSLAALAEIRG